MLGHHRNAVLQFSGGKDSTALMYLARPYLNEITVLFSETGATFPHLRRHVEQTCRKLGARMTIVHPEIDVHEHIYRNGFPSDIVPVEASAEMAPFLNPPPKQILQSYTQCCRAMLWTPMLGYMRENNVDLVLRGSKSCDPRVGVGPGTEIEGITYESPLWDWSDDDVYAYLKEQGAELPDQYPEINDSLDCWICTAHLAHHGDQKMHYIKKNYPDLWPVVSERMNLVRGIIEREAARIAPAMSVADG
jgi:3'-phosphoadenosine 5'-phosphosulfate sulfotransferase (PAPS reductase)/FAD synthetase